MSMACSLASGSGAGIEIGRRPHGGPPAAVVVDVEQRDSLVDALEQILDPRRQCRAGEARIASSRRPIAVVEFVGDRQEWPAVRCEIRRRNERDSARVQGSLSGNLQGDIEMHLASIVDDPKRRSARVAILINQIISVARLDEVAC